MASVVAPAQRGQPDNADVELVRCEAANEQPGLRQTVCGRRENGFPNSGREGATGAAIP